MRFTLVRWWPVLPGGEACSSAEGGFSGPGVSQFGFLSRAHFRVQLQGCPCPGRVQQPR